ncbi:MAG: peptidylprolyl isomerase, partial [Bacteroidetes bacterium]|nr:peptidylprolyl isomerase [Bacteroidota bacterium]
MWNINFISFLVLTVSICLPSSGQQDNVVDQIVAVVGDNVILKSEIEYQYHQYRQQEYFSTTGDLRCDILEELMYQKLLVDQAKIDSLEITLKEVEDYINRKLSMLIEQIGDPKKLEELFGKSVEEIKEDWKEPTKDQILAEKMQNKLSGEIKVTPAEVRNYFKGIPKDSLPLINAEMEYEQIVKYPAVTEEDKLEVIDRLRGFRERILNGEKFSMFASLYSEDPGSGSQGGELGFVGRGDLVPEFAAVAFNLKSDEVSRVVETEFGFHIIQMIEKKGELINVRHILLKPKIKESEIRKAKRFLDSIVRVIRMDTLTFSEAATRFSEDEASKFNGGLAVNMYTGSSRFEVDGLDGPTYYALKNLEIGEISAPFETIDTKGKKVYKIVRL